MVWEVDAAVCLASRSDTTPSSQQGVTDKGIPRPARGIMVAMNTRDRLRNLGQSIRDRAEPVHFAGRRKELDHILVNASHPDAGNTVVVQGAPGAGKTSLLREAAARFDTAGGRALFYGTPWSKDGERDVMRDIAIAAWDLDPGIFSATEQSAKIGKATVAGVGGSMTRTVRMPPVELTRWTAFARRYRDMAAESRMVMVLVDESQNLDEDAGELIHALHAQSDFPFTLVCGGLSDTKDKLREIGVSRLGGHAILRIGALTQEEAAESVHNTLHWTLDRCTDPPIRHDDEQIGRWTNRLAETSLGWPQHVASYLSGAWRALAGAERLDLGDERNLAAALDHGGELCSAYYQGRIEASQTDPAVILAAHGALSSGGDAFVLTCDAIEGAVDHLPAARRAAHRRNHPEGTLECYAKMLKAGVIEERDRERLGVPIPSLTMHLESVVAHRQGGEA